MIEQLGAWPVTDSEWDSDKAIDLEILVAVIKRNFTLGVLIEEWVGPDDRNSEKHIIQVLSQRQGDQMKWVEKH